MSGLRCRLGYHKWFAVCRDWLTCERCHVKQQRPTRAALSHKQEDAA